MNTSDQLLEMLRTIGEAESYLRKRCAVGQTGQSMALFQDLSALLDLLDSRYRKSGYLPKERAPIFGQSADILTAVNFLDDVDAWTGRIKDRVERRRVRQELARGSLFDAVVSEGRPFAQQAVALSQKGKNFQSENQQAEITGSPEERAEKEVGVSVNFSSAARQAAEISQQQPATPISAPPLKDTATSPLDIASEGARLFAGVRARTGRGASADAIPIIKPNSEEHTVKIKETELSANRQNARPMRASKENGVRPGASDENGTRPMGASSENGAKPMGASSESGAKPMGFAKEDTKRTGQSEAANSRVESITQELPKSLETSTTPAMGRGIAIDRAFLQIFNEIGTILPDALEKKLLQDFSKLENRYKMVMCDHTRRFSILGKLEPDRNEFSLLHRRAQELAIHRDEYAWLYGKLGDYRSRETLLALIDNWYTFNFKKLSNVKDKYFEMYLDADLLRCTDGETFVDIGAGNGDTLSAFTEFVGHWKKIYCYEPNSQNFAALQKAASSTSLTEIRQKAVSDRNENGLLDWAEDPLLSRLGDTGESVDTVTLDEDITGQISILKLCLEGGEQAAIRGCSDHIHKDHPRLIMRADHGDSDLWQLPRMIERLDKKYRFFLRHYGGNIMPSEYVLYAI